MPKKKIPKSEAISILIIVAIVALLFYFKNLFVAATVNGTSIPRLVVVDQLEKSAGKQTLDSLINQELLLQEAKRKKIIVSSQTVDQRINQIEANVKQQGTTLNQLLQTQGMSQQVFRNQVKLQLILEKLFANELKVTDKEIDQYLEENKASLPQTTEATETASLRQSVQQQIYQNKLGQKVQQLIETLKKSAKIDYFVNY